MEYTIEGIISEISKKNSGYTYKISGTEGFSINQQKGKEKEKSNVLCLKDTTVIDNKKPRNAIIFPIDSDFPADEKDLIILTTALNCGKKCIIELTSEEATKNFDSKDYHISSITLLAD